MVVLEERVEVIDDELGTHALVPREHLLHTQKRVARDVEVTMSPEPPRTNYTTP